VQGVGEPLGAEVLGEREHIAFGQREGIEPAAAGVDNDHDLAIPAAVLHRLAGALLQVDREPGLF